MKQFLLGLLGGLAVAVGWQLATDDDRAARTQAQTTPNGYHYLPEYDVAYLYDEFASGYDDEYDRDRDPFHNGLY